jgi:hypothetical protein
MEETMHIALRNHTEREIRRQIRLARLGSLRDVQPLVDEWMAVEEAVAGGVAHVLAPDIIQRYVSGLPQHRIAEELDARSGMERYRYLTGALAFVQEVGPRAAIHLYAADPTAFRNVLVRDLQP